MNELTVYHFMSDKLNLYSDIGNIMALKQRAKKRNIKINVKEINETEGVTFDDCDIFLIGGGSDREQALATQELSKIKTSSLDILYSFLIVSKIVLMSESNASNCKIPCTLSFSLFVKINISQIKYLIFPII